MRGFSGRKSQVKWQSIRWRLMIGFVLMTLLPAAGITIISILIEYQNVRQLVYDRLESVASQRKNEIETWVEAVRNEMLSSLNENYALDRAEIILNLANRDVYFDTYLKSARIRLQRAVTQSTQQVTGYAYVDLEAEIVLSTREDLEGELLAALDGFQPTQETVFVQFPENSAGEDLVIVALPVIDWSNQPVGALVAFVSGQPVEKILENSVGLGPGGKAYLVNQSGKIISPGALLASWNANQGEPISSIGIDALVTGQGDGQGQYRDFQGEDVIGVYTWLPVYRIGLLVEQPQAEAFRAIGLIFRSNILVAVFTILLAVGISLLITRSILNPLTELVHSATEIAAGDLSHTVGPQKMDEIGVLADAFNRMTGQLREFIGTLEMKVDERTFELQQRALQLETSAEVSRGITSILSIDDLLRKVVELICDSFDYDQVQIYLLDESTGNAVLRAGTTSHALPIETGMQLAIPLKMGNKPVGTLDIRRDAAHSFSRDEIKLMESLGDQIAIAIENARLYQESQKLAVLEERNRLARDLHDSVTQSLYSISLIMEGWSQAVVSGAVLDTQDRLQRVAEITGQALREMRLMIFELRPPELEKMGLMRALNHRLDSVEQRAGIDARLVADEIIRLPVEVEKEMYWIAVEALNNVLRHSGATSVRLSIKNAPDSVTLVIRDNGLGFHLDEAGKGGGMGLLIMRERTEKIHGTFEIETKPGGGTIIRVCAPLFVLAV